MTERETMDVVAELFPELTKRPPEFTVTAPVTLPPAFRVAIPPLTFRVEESLPLALIVRFPPVTVEAPETLPPEFTFAVPPDTERQASVPLTTSEPPLTLVELVTPAPLKMEVVPFWTVSKPPTCE